MNGARNGAQGSGEPVVHANGTSDPSLDHLIRALTAHGYPHELTGRDAALSAFRAASAERGQRSGHAWRAARRRRGPLPARAVAVAGAGVALLAGFTAAAYAQALPASVQRIAHSVLAPFGVPDSGQRSPGHRSVPQRSAPGPESATAQAPAATPSAGSASAPPSSPPSSPPSPSASPSSPSPASSPATVAAGMSIQLQVVPGQSMDHMIVTVSAPASQPGGTVVLEEMTGGTWQTVDSRARGGSTRIDFPLRASSAAGQLFRAELDPGAGSPADSNLVTAPDSASHPGK